MASYQSIHSIPVNVHFNGDNNLNTHRYTSRGWMGRKLLALPRAAWSGVVLSLAHLAQAAFRLINCNQEGALCSSRTIKHDMKEACGHISTLFSDRFGSRMVNSARQTKNLLNDGAAPQPELANLTPKAFKEALKGLENIGDERHFFDVAFKHIYDTVDRITIDKTATDDASQQVKLTITRRSLQLNNQDKEFNNWRVADGARDPKLPVLYSIWKELQVLKNQQIFGDSQTFDITFKVEIGSQTRIFNLSIVDNGNGKGNLNLKIS